MTLVHRVRAAAVGGTLLGVVLGGCSGGASGPATASVSSSAVISANTQTLLQARDAAGIPACPATDPATDAVPGGLPKLTLDCLGGDSQVNLAALGHGKPLVVNFWAQWCGPCRTEAPYLAELNDRRGSQLLLVGVDYVDPHPDFAVALAAESRLSYPMLVDPEGTTRAPLRLPGIPQTFLVDAKGVVAYRTGPLESYDQLAQLVQHYLGVTL